MLTDGFDEAWDGVRGVANDVAERGGSVLAFLVLAVLVFALCATVGFVGRLLWPGQR